MAPRLVVVAGPIAAGKSALATALGARWRAGGRSVAVVGLDELAAMALPPCRTGDGPTTCTPARWQHGCAPPVDVVVAEGPADRAEIDTVLTATPTGTASRVVLVHCDLTTALRRVAADPTRTASKDPDFLRAVHARFAAAAPAIRPDVTVDTAACSLDCAVDAVVEILRR